MLIHLLLKFIIAHPEEYLVQMLLSQKSITPRMMNKVGVAMEGTEPTLAWDRVPHVV